MKKALLLALAVMLALSSLSFALAEEEQEAGFFELLSQDGGDLKPVTCAVPVARGVVAAPAALLPVDLDRLVISDGVSQWETKAVIPDESGSIVLLFYDSQEQTARYGAWPLLPWGAGTSADACLVRGADGTDRGVTAAEEIRWKEKRCYLLSLTDAAPAGSPLLTEYGQLAGIVIAEWAEGINRVLVLSAEELAADMTRASLLLNNLPDWGTAPEGLNVTLKKNRVIIDWKDMALPEKKEDEQIYMVLFDTGNTYLNYFPAETNERALSLLLTPGRFYLVGAIAAASAPDTMPESYAVISVPPAQKLTDYGFQPVLTAIAEGPEEGLKDGEKPVPVTEVTEELLRSGRAYFYSHSSYEVTGTVSDLSLLITLTDPNGVSYGYESAWVYMQDYNQADIWFLPLQDMGLTANLDRSGYPAGTYRIAYYVDGDLADSFEFELK